MTLNAQNLELLTRELFIECMVPQHDMDVFTVSGEDIEYPVGE